jgi:hypothetical protein
MLCLCVRETGASGKSRHWQVRPSTLPDQTTF